MSEERQQPLVIVTGSSGLIGRAVTRSLADGCRVAGFDRDAPQEPAKIEFLRVDVTSDESVGAAVGQVRRRLGERVASVVHLAAYYDFSGEPSPLYEEITVRGSERLLRSLRDLRVEQFVFSSTMLVHAPCRPGQRINEDWPLAPAWDYPQSKADTERLLLAAHGDVPVVLLRIAGVYDDRCHSLPLANQIQRIYERRLTAKVFPGDTATGQSFVHLDDLVDLVSRVVTRRAELPPELTLLVGEPETLSYDELQRTLAWLIHGEREWETTQVPKAAAKAGAWVQDQVPGLEEPFIKPWMIDLADDHYELDTTRARKLLDWSPRRALRETLPKMVELLHADPAAFYRENKLKGSPPPAPVEHAGAAAGARHGS